MNTRPQSRPEAELPELPRPHVRGTIPREGTNSCTTGLIGFTAEQMRAYGQQCAATRQKVAPSELVDAGESVIRDIGEMIRMRSERSPAIAQMQEWQSVINLLLANVQDNRPAEVGGVERDAARFRALEAWFDGLKSYQARIVFDYMGLTHADECNAGFGDATDALIENKSTPGSEATS